MLFFFLCISVVNVFADSNEKVRDLIRQQQSLQQRDEQRRKQLIEEHRKILEEPPAKIDEVLQEGKDSEETNLCFAIHSITFTGATLLSSSEKKHLISPYVNTCLALPDINKLLRDVTNFYIEKGYVTTRAAVPQQNLKDGTLEILVVEGKLESLSFQTPPLFSKTKLLLAFPVSKGSFLNIRDLEQGIDQLNRLPSNNAKLDLIPGKKVGTTDVVVKNSSEKTWRVAAGIENSGQESTGEIQYVLAFEKDNLLGINDLFSANYNGDYRSLADGERQRSNSLSGIYSVGIGYWLFTGTISDFEYRTKVQGTTEDLSSVGRTTTGSLLADYVFFRDADSKSSLGLGMTIRDTSNSLAGVKLEVSSLQLTVGDVSLTHTERLWDGVATIRAQYGRGLPFFGAQHDGRELLSSDPKAQFDKVTGSITYYKPFKVQELNLSVNSKVVGQWSPDTLYSSERLCIGSRYTVRGFQESCISGDSGGYTRNEVALTIPVQEEKIFKNLVNNVQFFVGYDAGFIRDDPVDDLERGVLQGASIGIRTIGGVLSADLTLSKPLDAPMFIESNDVEFYAAVKLTY